jgi:hypothetical protein
MKTAISEPVPGKADYKTDHEAERKKRIEEAKSRLFDQHVKEPAAMICEQDNRVSHVSLCDAFDHRLMFIIHC